MPEPAKEEDVLPIDGADVHEGEAVDPSHLPDEHKVDDA